ncbi:MAG TPA: hypothetical protein VFF33_04520 [Ignavibacteriaceae bacterium]|nr:hypothetical protein [Ignavibacteriaceae bacterium]
MVNKKWVGVESATGTGKTFIGALITFWFIECFPNSIVVTTAPKQEQLSLHLWKEIRNLYPLFNKGELLKLRLRLNYGNDNRIALGFAAGIKADEESATKAQGFHAENMLIILEETPGIPMSVITALQNTCTSSNNLMLAFGNPDNQLDNLHRFCMLDNVEHIIISAFDHPNVVCKNSLLIPGAASMEGINRMKVRYGEESPLYLSRARGISPMQSIDSLIQVEWCIDAKDNEYMDGDYALGVDAANSETGDKAAIALGKGNKLIEVNAFQCPDSGILGKRDIVRYMNDYKISADKVGVDGIGVGAGTINALKEINIKVVNILSASSPVKINSAENFINLRSQMYWQLREDLRLKRIIIPNDNELITDLTSIKWFLRNGKIAIEPKEEIKKRIGRSTNKGDAVVYWNWVRIRRSTYQGEWKVV